MEVVCAHLQSLQLWRVTRERKRDPQSKSLMWVDIANPHVQMDSSIQILKLTLKEKTKVAHHMCPAQKVLQMNIS